MTDFYAGRRVLVTGGLGFIGSALVLRLIDRGAAVTVVDALLPQYGGSRRHLETVADRVRVETTDLRDRGRLDPLVRGAQTIFALAGQVSHSESMRDPFTDLEVNARAHLCLLESCRQGNREARVVFAGTRQVYGRPRRMPVDEDHPLDPVDVNGVHKLAAEMYLKIYHQVYGMPTVSLRLTNTYGPRMDLENHHKGVVAVFLQRALRGQVVQVFGSGRQRRDFNYVDDVAEAFLLAGERPGLEGGTFNLGHPDPCSLLEFLSVLQQFLPFEVACVPFPDESARIDIGDYVGDFSRFQKATGWAPRTSLKEGLERTVRHFRATA